MFYYRLKSTGEVLGAAHSASQDRGWVERYAANLEAPASPDDIEEFESEADQRPANARREKQAPQPQNPRQEAIAAIEAATTVEGLKSAVLAYIRA